jgi:hypothetical protein
MYDWTTCGDGNPTLYYLGLPPGTYYVPVFSDVDNQNAYTITISGEACPPAPPNDNCEDVIPLPLNLGDELTFGGTTAGATATCYLLGWPGDVWDAVETTEPLDITVDYCGTSPAFGYFGNVLVEGCPCTGWYHYGQYNETACGDDNATITYYNVPAGTWYVPTYSGLNAYGPYTMHVTASAPTPPPGCPADSLYSQPPQGPGEPLVAPTSAQTSEFSYLCQEKFSGITQKIGKVRWWGLALHFDGQQWVPCYPFGVPFEIVFYEDDNGAPGGAGVHVYRLEPGHHIYRPDLRGLRPVSV